MTALHAEHPDRALDVFAHELGNRVLAIATGAELLRRMLGQLTHEGVTPGQDAHQALSIIQNGADRIQELTVDLLRTSSLDNPRHQDEVSEIDLTALVREEAELVAGVATGLDVRIRCLAEDPVRLVGDAGALRAMVGNLLSNAVKYSRPGGEVLVDLRRLDESDPVAELTVVDHGVGISEAHLPRIFDTFFRAPDPEVLRRPGTGLGLAIVRRVVERHAGRIHVDSRPDCATRVRVCLPIR